MAKSSWPARCLAACGGKAINAKWYLRRIARSFWGVYTRWRLFAEWADQTIRVVGTHFAAPPPATLSATA